MGWWAFYKWPASWVEYGIVKRGDYRESLSTETSCIGSILSKVPADFQGTKATNTRYLAL